MTDQTPEWHGHRLSAEQMRGDVVYAPKMWCRAPDEPCTCERRSGEERRTRPGGSLLRNSGVYFPERTGTDRRATPSEEEG